MRESAVFAEWLAVLEQSWQGLPDKPEEAPEPGGDTETPPQRNDHLLLLSARTREALERVTGNLVTHVKANPDLNLADAAFTLQVGRKPFKYRRMLLCSRVDEIEGLFAAPVSVSLEGNPAVIFMFPGQGGQYLDMGLDLYRTEPVFQGEMDRCFDLLKPLLRENIKEILYPAGGNVKSALERIQQPEILQCLIFIIEYALARLLMEWGIRPTALVGYSLGEYTAACLSGVFSLAEALKVVVHRGKLIGKVPPGVMLSVPLPENELKPLLPKDDLFPWPLSVSRLVLLPVPRRRWRRLPGK